MLDGQSSHSDPISGWPEADKLAEWFGLSDRQVDWVQSAKAGNDEDGFSEALLGVEEEGWYPLRIRASELETDVIDCGWTQSALGANRPEDVSESAAEPPPSIGNRT